MKKIVLMTTIIVFVFFFGYPEKLMCMSRIKYNVNDISEESFRKWEEDNRDFLTSIGHFNRDENIKYSNFVGSMFLNKYRNREDYSIFENLDRESIIAIYKAFEDGTTLENSKLYRKTKYKYSKALFEDRRNAINKSPDEDQFNQKWWGFHDKMMEASPHYKGYYNRYIYIDENKRSEYLSTYMADVELFGEDFALQKAVARIQNDFAAALTTKDKASIALSQFFANAKASVAFTIGIVGGGIGGLLGFDLSGGRRSRDDVDFLTSLYSSMYGNPITEYGYEVSQNAPQIVRSMKDERIGSRGGMFNEDAIFELIGQSGYFVLVLLFVTLICKFLYRKLRSFLKARVTNKTRVINSQKYFQR